MSVLSRLEEVIIAKEALKETENYFHVQHSQWKCEPILPLVVEFDNRSSKTFAWLQGSVTGKMVSFLSLKISELFQICVSASTPLTNFPEQSSTKMNFSWQTQLIASNKYTIFSVGYAILFEKTRRDSIVTKFNKYLPYQSIIPKIDWIFRISFVIEEIWIFYDDACIEILNVYSLKCCPKYDRDWKILLQWSMKWYILYCMLNFG